MTAICLLQSVCRERKWKPDWQQLDRSGQSQFVFECRAGGHYGMGGGVSKRKAKQTAALRLLQEMRPQLNETELAKMQQLLQQGQWWQQQQQQQQQAKEEKRQDGPTDNPVGELQEMCHRRKWPPATFEFSWQGVNGESTCTGRLERWCERVSAPSKRLAKRRAAAALLRRVEEESSVELSLNAERLQRLVESKELQASVKAGTELSRCFERIRNRKGGQQLTEIDEEKLKEAAGGSAIAQLKRLAAEQNFALTFLKQEVVEFKDSQHCDGLHRCLLKINTMPTILSIGLSRSAELSREMACRGALDHLCQVAKCT